MVPTTLRKVRQQQQQRHVATNRIDPQRQIQSIQQQQQQQQQRRRLLLRSCSAAAHPVVEDPPDDQGAAPAASDTDVADNDAHWMTRFAELKTHLQALRNERKISEGLSPPPTDTVLQYWLNKQRYYFKIGRLAKTDQEVQNRLELLEGIGGT